MWLRANIVLAIAVVFAVVQMFASVTGGPRFGDMTALASSPNSGLTRTVAAQDDDNDEDDDDDNDDDEDEDNDDSDDEDEDNDDSDDSDNDDDDSDNDDSDSDNDEDDSDNDDSDSDNDDSDSDNDDSDSDNDDEDDSDNDDDEDTSDDDPSDIGDDVLDNVDTSASTSAAPASTTGATAAAPSTTTGTPSPSLSAVSAPGASPQAMTEAQLVTASMDATLSLQGDRLSVQVFSTMPAGVTLKLRIVDPLMYPATPGIRAGDLIFQLDATDVSGMPLATLPSEVNISVRYQDSDVTGLDDTAITLARLDTFDSTWKPAPKLLTDPATNYLAASVMDTGVYAVYVP